jgi:hypothetical protein
MASQPYLVVRLLPEAPVDGASFSTYLDGLQLQVLDAFTNAPLSDLVYSSPLSLFQWPLGSGGTALAAVSDETSAATTYVSSGDYGNTLTFDSTEGISVGSYVFTTDQTSSSGPTINPSDSYKVTDVKATTVTLNANLSNYVPAGTVVSFIGNSFTANGSNPSAAAAQFSLNTNGAAATVDGQPASAQDPLVVLPFTSTAGVAVGMMVAGTDIAAGTTVAEVTATTVTLSQALLGSPASGSSIQFTLSAPFASLTLTPTASASTQLTFTSAAGVAYGMTLNPLAGYIAPGTTVVEATATVVTLSQPLIAALPANQAVTFTFPLSSGIVQHVTEVLNISFFDISVVAVPAAVATAVIPLNLPSPPPDYLNVIVAASRPKDIIPINTTFYNVLAQTDAPPAPDLYQLISPSETSFYVTLPPQPGTTPIALAIPSDGSPPPFDELYPAVVSALTNDPFLGPVTATTNVAPLVAQLVASSDQCTRVAYDIVWSYQNSLPIPPDPLEALYTNPPNPGSSSPDSNNGDAVLEQDRQKFEGTLNSFYSTRNATAERLAKFVAAVSAAVFCEQTSLYSSSALLEFPVDPSSTFATAVESEVLLQDLGGSRSDGINFGVPAAFFYALGAKMDKSTTALQRYQMATGDAIERLLQEFDAAEDTDVISDSEAFSDPTFANVSISSFQAARRLVALGVSAASTSPQVPLLAGSSLASLVTHWLAAIDPTVTTPPTPPPNPPLSYQNKDFNIWSKQLSQSDPAGYLALDLDALTQGYVIPTFTAQTSVNAASGSTLTFSSTTGLGIGVGMPVSGTNIPAGATVQSVTTATTQAGITTTVTLSAPVSGGVPSNEAITFNATIAPVAATTSADSPSGTTLTFTTPPGVTGIKAGMLAAGTNIASGATVSSVSTAANTVTLNTAVLGDVPNGSLITFTTPVPPNTVPSTLADQIALWLPSTTSPATPQPTVATLIQVTAAQWTSFFDANPSWLPPFTQPVAPGASQAASTQTAGYTATRIRAFIRAVQKFFTVSSVATSAQPWTPGAPPAFALPTYDPITLAVESLPAGFTFGTAISSAELDTAVQAVFPNDTAAQAWLTQAITAIDQLYEVAKVVPNPVISGYTSPNPVSLGFSVAEALYARGFSNAADITRLSANDFQQALTGTVAYDFATGTSGTSLYQAAQQIAPHSPPAGGGSQSFQPINPDGQLTNCIPPPCLSPTGPAAYLADLLKLAETSTCAQPFAAPASGHTTLGAAVAARRGPLGNLLASCANVETPLPLIDIVNECLEFMGAAAANTTGTVYATSADQLAGYLLCQKAPCPEEADPDCHEPEAMFAALPEYSTPATPTAANQSVEPAVYNNLKSDFSSCDLPYSQALDVSRSYLGYFGSSRFEELRRFRKCITEFALDPANPPTDFQSYLSRYPARIEIAIEYLGITPEEYASLFQGTAPQACCTTGDRQAAATTAAVPGWELYGFPSARTENWASQVSVLSEFLSRTCLSYCEFLELWNAVQGPSTKDREVAQTAYPKCEPCCLQDYRLQIPEGEAGEQQLTQLAIFIRLWRKLHCLCGGGYSFAQLWDICTVLQLYNGTAINPEFIRQLAAFQMLRDVVDLPLSDPADQSAGATGADRTQLLSLWVGSGAKYWNWAVARLLDGVADYARTHFGRTPASHDMGHLAGKLDALSRLAGFNPATASNPSSDTWNSDPACTLRFAEVLAKILASDFKPDELLYLFNAEAADQSDGWFEQLDADDADTYPLDLPAHDDRHSLWELRAALLAVEVSDEEIHAWTWPRLVRDLREHFGYAPPAGQQPLLSLGQHFFPGILEAAGFSVTPIQQQYRTALTSTAAWNTPASPFHYDTSASQLWLQLPLRDEEVAAKLSQLAELGAAEQAAVQDLYFAPRADLAQLGFLFPDWQAAEIHLIQEPDEARRWWYFRRHVALAEARRKVIAAHLAGHVAHRTGCRHDDLDGVAALVLSQLLSDENTGAPWEADSGVPPAVMWTPPAGGAVAALLGLAGTGLCGDYEIAAAPVSTSGANAQAGAGTSWQTVWRDVRGPMEAFGHQRDQTNSPVPTVLPALALSFAGPPLTVQNGYASTSDGHRLGGDQAFRVCWSGMLLVDGEGDYAFHAGAPTPEGERPDFHRAETSQWRVTLQRGKKPLLVLNHQWPGETEQERSVPRLRRGAYRITVEFAQPAPDFAAPHPHPQQTGFQLKYAGPDSGGIPITLPLKNLYRDLQGATLDTGITFLPGAKNAQAFLKGFYTSTLRDIRRTYQRAFKAVLFCGGLKLSARRVAEAGQSELGYMLANPKGFAGHAYYRTSATSFATHLADFDFNFLPITDDFHPPVSPAPNRSAPSLQRTQAMFDWWERMFDYVRVRDGAAHRGTRHLWLLFHDALVNPPANAVQLLRSIGADAETAPLGLRYYQDQNSPIYTVSSSDLTDERWLVRVWHAESWIRALQRNFHPRDIAEARPDLWAAADPSAPVPASGVTETGNANLTALLNAICLDNGEPRRTLDIKRLNDGLRERGRAALVAYLCAMNRVALPFQPGAYATAPQDLGDLLLLDVQTGICERASRIEEAITAVQNFIRRSRLTLEPGWKVSREFARLWDSSFATFRIWERARRQEIYLENWIEWDELGKARRIEAFRFLETQLRSSTLSLAAPGGTDWWMDGDEPLEFVPKLIQRRDPSELQPLVVPPQSVTREGLATIGNPEHTGEPAWLAAVPATGAAASSPPPPSASGGSQIAQAAATATAQPLPLWMEAATKLGTRFLRIAAAGVPQAALGFVPHADDPHGPCCHDCGEDHPVLMDEYYFWLVDAEIYTYTDQTDSQDLGDASFDGSYQFGFQDSFYDQVQQQSAEWDDEDQVPQLLAKWQPNPAVRLAWCRVHNGQFGQPRKSDLCVQVNAPPTGQDLVFLGRAADSLYFAVSNAAPPAPGYTDKSPPGFRYDLPSDCAAVLPEVLPAPPTTETYPAGLLSYPFYAYHDPGAPLFPRSWFAPALAVADALRAHCGFELALKWYARAFNPLQNDCTWMDCPDQGSGTTGTTVGVQGGASSVSGGASTVAGAASTAGTSAQELAVVSPTEAGGGTAGQGACCDSANVTEAVARHRSLTLRFCQTLLEWGDAMMRHRNAPEAFQQARLLYATVAKVMGPRPNTVLLQEPASSQPISSFTPAFAPLNPRLLDLYTQLDDRFGMLNACLDARRLRDGLPNRDLAYFGNNPLREGWRSAETCADEMEWCHRVSPYRFVFLIQKATELAGRVRELGAALLAAYEKGDGEYLASLRAGQERELLALGLSIRQDQWRDADWQVQALQQTKDVSQTNLIYFTGLYQNGLLNNENQNISLATNAMQMRTSANITEAFGEAMKVIPDIFVGFCSSDTQVPIGTKLAGVFETIAKVMLTVADVQSETAAIDLTEAGWQRRSDEWFHQTLVLPIEIQQVELQILGAQRRRDQAMQDLNNQQRQIENATEVLDFLRDKFTATELYLWLQKETAALYCQMYELANRASLQAQHAYNLERGHTTRRFVPEWAWDNLHAGLLAGERLEASLHHMEMSYLDENVREYELSKHLSLRLHFPMAFLRLRATGRCEIDIPEWMFDLDYPGHYMRRIRNVTLTIPCVTGPYTGVHCRLTLLSSITRIDPRLAAPAHDCCCPAKPGCCHGKDGGTYLLCPDDPRMVKIFGARDAIATSGGQNDSGLFELSFSDPRYLPFEYMGAVSRWRIELPPENNYFDPNTLTDTVLHLNYTAREGGELLRHAATAAARGKLPGDGWAFFDLRHDFPDAWELFHRPVSREDDRRDLALHLRRKFFPYLPGNPELRVTRFMLLFETAEMPERAAPQAETCCCPEREAFGSHVVTFRDRADPSRRDGESKDLVCHAASEWPRLYSGMIDAAQMPFRRGSDGCEIAFGFPDEIGDIAHAYLFCRYEPVQDCHPLPSVHPARRATPTPQPIREMQLGS